MRKRLPAASDRAAATGTLKADTARYLPLVRHLADWVSRRSEIRAWFPHCGDLPRAAIRRDEVLRIIGIWKAADVAHRTINNRVSALRDLYHKLDGDDAETPCDHVPFLKPPRTPIPRISAETINAVLHTLQVRALTTEQTKGRPVCHALAETNRASVSPSLTSPSCTAASRPPECANPPVGNAESEI